MDTPAPPPMTMPSSKEMYGFGYLAITLFMVYSCVKNLHVDTERVLEMPLFPWQIVDWQQG